MLEWLVVKIDELLAISLRIGLVGTALLLAVLFVVRVPSANKAAVLVAVPCRPTNFKILKNCSGVTPKKCSSCWRSTPSRPNRPNRPSRKEMRRSSQYRLLPTGCSQFR